MNTEKLVIIWQNFARVRLQLKFAYMIRPLLFKTTWPFFSSRQALKVTSLYHQRLLSCNLFLKTVHFLMTALMPVCSILQFIV